MKDIVRTVIVLAIVAIAIALVADAKADSAVLKDRAETAESRAEVAQEQAEQAWEAYTALGDTVVLLVDSLEAVEAEATEAREDARTRVDTLRLQVPDTGAVPRPLHDSIVESLEDVVEATAAERDASRERAILWQRRWQAADSTLALERQVNAELRVAVERWREAASPGWLTRLKRNAETVGLAALGGAVLWEVVR